MSADHNPDSLKCFVCGPRWAADALANILLFAPLGAALALGRLRGLRPVWYALLLSCAVELVQLVIPGRDASLADVVFNTLGAAVGLLAVRFGRPWLTPNPRRSARLSVGASVAAAAAFGVTAWLITPTFPASAYRVWWTPDRADLTWYRGRVLQAALNSMTLRPGTLLQPGSVRRMLITGAPLRIEALAGPRTTSLSPLLVVEDDRERELLLIGVDRDDLVFRHHTRAAEFRLDRTDLRLRKALARVVPGDTLHIEVRTRSGQYFLILNHSHGCAGITIGNGWALVLYPAHFPLGLQQLLGVVWVAGLAFPVGLWSRKRVESLVAAAVLLAGTVGLPPSVGLLPTPLAELLGVAGGWALGVAVHRFLMKAQ